MALAVLRSAAIGLDTWLATRIARASVARSATSVQPRQAAVDCDQIGFDLGSVLDHPDLPADLGDGREAGQTPVARKTRVERELTGGLGLDDRLDRQLRATSPFEDVDWTLVCEEDSQRGRHLGESGPSEPDTVRGRGGLRGAVLA